MSNKDMILEMMRSQGKFDALDLRGRAKDMDGTSIIAEENKAPDFDPNKDYSPWPVGSPVRDKDQVYTLIRPHNAANHPGSRPETLPALWSVTHTKDPMKAKPYMPPSGTSGLYSKDECCTKDGKVWISKEDGNAYPPNEVGTEAFWNYVGEVENDEG